MRRRGKVYNTRTTENDSFSSSDSDGGFCSQRSRKSSKTKSCGAKKKKGLCSFPKFVNPIGDIRCAIARLGSSCIILPLMIFIALLLLYFFGPYIWRLFKSILPASWFKSTATIIDEALAKYHADKLALADYALESAGGSILCNSNTFYTRDGALYSIFGVPLWYHASSPREVIQPGVQPGECWAMDGSRGYVMIQLTMPVVVTGVSLEHIPAQVAPTGKLDSAPKDFVVVGKENHMDSPDVVLGTFTYKVNGGESIQTYRVRDPHCIRQTTNFNECGPNHQVFRIIELRILSNHGNKDYTCIYRFRVHGKPLNQAVLDQEEHGGGPQKTPVVP